MMYQSAYPNLPRRIAGVLSALYEGGGRAENKKKFAVIDAILADEKIPLNLGVSGVHRKGDQMSREVFRIVAKCKTMLAIKMQVFELCKANGINMPVGETDGEILKRALDKAWWVRNLSIEVKRRHELANIQLGITGGTGDEYLSREVAMMQKRQNTANRKLLESVIVTNGIDKYSLAELADLGMANKTLRKNELMTRIRGFEEIATELNHTAMFWTITCPSAYHSVQGRNKKYNGATPRQAQKYLCKIWSRMRAAFNREGIRPYGFRIAEPHTDGTPHWHMLFFVDRKDAARMEQIIKHHALAEDFGEWKEEENRVKLVHIETHNGMSAAGYIVKYISKNIDGGGVGDHMSFKDGETYIIKSDMLGQEEIVPSQRVTYWSQVWGIRQFQQIGGAPVGVWRELRRVPAEGIDKMPYEVQEAWEACQKDAVVYLDKEKKPVLDDNGNPTTQASFANYLRAQGGVHMGKNYRVRIYKETAIVEGKYATYEQQKPVGIYAASAPDEIIKSKRYTWERVDVPLAVDFAFAFGGSRTGVNNCTDYVPHWQETKAKQEEKNQKFSRDYVDEAIRDSQGWDFEREYDKNGKLIRNSWVKYRRPRG